MTNQDLKEKATEIYEKIESGWNNPLILRSSEIELIAAALLSVRKETRGEDCEAICIGCRHALPLKKVDNKLEYHETNSNDQISCKAQAIRELGGI